MDHGNPRMVFIVSAIAGIAALATVAGGKRPAAKVAA